MSLALASCNEGVRIQTLLCARLAECMVLRCRVGNTNLPHDIPVKFVTPEVHIKNTVVHIGILLKHRLS